MLKSLGQKRLFSGAAQLIGLKPALSDLVVDVKKLESLSTAQLALLWEEYHAESTSKNSEVQIAGRTIAAPMYATIKANATQSPLFVLPNYRKDVNTGAMGFCTLFTEFAPKTDFVVMTMLDEYRTQGSAAAPWLSLAFYDNFQSADGANLVLLQTKFNAMQLTRAEAIVLTERWLNVYSAQPESPNSPFIFNHRSTQFNFDQAFRYEQDPAP